MEIIFCVFLNNFEMIDRNLCEIAKDFFPLEEMEFD